MLPRYLSCSCDLYNVFSIATSLRVLSLVYLQVTRWCSQTYSWIFLVQLCLHFHGFSYIHKKQRMPACITGGILGNIPWLNLILVAITLCLKKKPEAAAIQFLASIGVHIKKTKKVHLDHILLFRHLEAFIFSCSSCSLNNIYWHTDTKKKKKNQLI